MTPQGERFLLDTHTFLWMTGEPERLGRTARKIVDGPANRLLLSVVSVWEMAIKASLGKLELPGTVESFVAEQLTATRTDLLDIRWEHAVRVEELPWHHRDPFDRLLIAQARFEHLPILGRDPVFQGYPVELVW